MIMPENVINLEWYRDAEKDYIHLKEQTKEWLENNYEISKRVHQPVYFLVFELEKSVGYLNNYVLSLWLRDWGYTVQEFKTGYSYAGVLIKKRRKSKPK